MIIKSPFRLHIPTSPAYWLVSLVVAFSACSEKGIDVPAPNPGTETASDTCILIYTDETDSKMKHEVADFALEQFNEAQQGLSHHVDVSFRYVDVNAQDFLAAASTYLLSGKYPYIIGPDESHTSKADGLLTTASNCFSNPNKAPAILFPSMMSIDVMKKAQTMLNVRVLSTDGRDMLSAALKASSFATMSPYVFLLCSDDDTERTYSRFFAEYAPNDGFSWSGKSDWRGQHGLINVSPDISRTDLEAKIDSAYRDFCGQLSIKADSCRFFNFIVATNNPEHGLLLDSLRYEKELKDPRFGLTEIILLNGQKALARGERYHDATSLSLSAKPTNKDFAEEFCKRFGRYPVQGEAHFYDAVLMSLYAEYNRRLQNNHLDEGEAAWTGSIALKITLDGKEKVGASWKSEGIRKALESSLSKKLVKLHGASSDWDFIEEDGKTSAQHTYYSLNYLDEEEQNQKDIPDGWASSDQNNNVWYDNTVKTAWVPDTCVIETALTNISRPFADLKDRWALLIAGTKAQEDGKQWGENYRHQADVWNMYHLLRHHGYADDHIIVVTEDDIFEVKLFKDFPGDRVVIRPHDPEPVNLYDSISPHYRLSDITQQDIIDIIAGKQSAHLPKVIQSTDADNVLIYWSGHGNSEGELRWDGKDSEAGTGLSHKFAPVHMQTALTEMCNYKGSDARNEYKYRRLLLMVESCHSGKFISSMPALEGMLYMAASEDQESSWADDDIITIKNAGITIHLFDRYSAGFVNLVERFPTISFSDLHDKLYNLTTDSHPVVYNTVNFGNLQKIDFTEFRKP